MKNHPPPTPAQRKEGFIYGLLGVLAFGTTLPSTRLSVQSFDPILVGVGRGLVAAILCLPILLITRQPRPTFAQFRRLLIVILGAVFGFPLLVSWAMHRTEASHGAVLIGLMPMVTVIAGFIIAHERPSFAFWCASAFGSATVVSFALASGGGHFHAADFALLGAVILGAMGYAEGGRLGRELGGWQTIFWALAYSIPLLLLITVWAGWHYGVSGTKTSWLAFGWLSVVSGFLGFFAWYHGLAVGGVARVSQIQLLQPFFTLVFAASFLGEHLGFGTLISAILVAASILISRRSRIVTLIPPPAD